MSDCLDQLLRRAWPSGAPAEERAFYRTLSETRRHKVLLRLEAVLAVEEGIAEVTSGAGLGRAAFHKLRRDWSRQRSLRSLVPYEKRDPASVAFVEPVDRQGVVAVAQAAERMAAVEAIRSDPAADNGSVARRIAAELGSGLDPRTMIKLVRQERRLLHFKPHLLLGVYGRSILADISALDLVVERDGVKHRAVIALVLERSSTLTLGYAVGTRDEGLELQRRAAERAVATLAALRADVQIDVPVAMDLVVGPGSNTDVDDLARHATTLLGGDRVSAKGRLRFGRKAASLIGGAGRFRMMPALTVPVRDGLKTMRNDSVVATVEEADLLLGAEFRRHDESAIRALKMIGLAGGGEASGAMARLIGQVFRL